MQTRADGLTNASKGSEESRIKCEASRGLADEIQALLAPHGVGPEVVARVLNEVLLEINNKS